MNVLVTGGAGYIGSHAVKHLVEAGHTVVVVDNLGNGHTQAVHDKAAFVEADVRDLGAMKAVLREHRVECVMHFAALAYVGESVEQPLKYWDNNTIACIRLLQAMDEVGVKKLVFSSTCATYGEPDTMPIVETTPQDPINPYGASKLAFERILKDYCGANGEFAFAALRYFNVAGSAADTSIGEDHAPETHIIPILLQAAQGKRSHVTIFGEDYATPDGSCIRDYIHVEDLVDAHAVVMGALQPGDQRFYNLGIGNGLSVKQLIDAAKRVTGVDFEVRSGDRRPGDPPQLYADPSKIRNELGWQAKTTDIDEIITTAWKWFEAHPDGYED